MANRRGSGEGSIYKDADGRWRGSVHLGYKAGKRVRKVVSGKTRVEVAEKLKKLLHSQQLGLPVGPERLTLGQWLPEWLSQSVKNRVRPKSYVFYESIVRLHLVPDLGRIRIRQLTPQRVGRLLNSKLESGLSPRMVRHIRTTLITALETALKFGLVSRNVAKLVDPPRVPKREIFPFTVEEARRFLEVVKGDRLGNLFVIMLSLGLRLGEALGLTWDDIDFERSRLTVRHGLEKVTGQPFRLVETKSEGGYHTICLPAVAIAALVLRQNSVADENKDRLLQASGLLGVILTRPALRTDPGWPLRQARSRRGCTPPSRSTRHRSVGRNQQLAPARGLKAAS